MATPERQLAEKLRHPNLTLAAPIATPPGRVRASELTLAGAFAHCRTIAARHADAFPLSRVPPHLTPFFDSVFAFARTADEIADAPGDVERRRVALAAYRQRLVNAFDGEVEHPIFVALARTAELFELPFAPFEQILEGVELEVRGQPFGTYGELERHCRRIAVPMGELVLRLFDVRDGATLRAGDALAIAVCETDFWEDIAVDARRGRVYVPAEDLRHFGVAPADLLRGVTPACRALLRFEAMRTRALLARAEPLSRRLRGPAAGEIALLQRATERRLAALVDGKGPPEPLPLARARSRWAAALDGVRGLRA